jgi:hypothetical protein
MMSVLLLAPSLATAETLPKQLSNAEFWRLINDISEPDGPFISENFVSNEPNFQQILTELKSSAKSGGAYAYLGVGPEQNFTYIAALRPGMAFIIDIRRQNLLQHLIYKAIFELSPDRADFLSILFSRKRPTGLTDKSTIEDLFKAYKTVAGDAELEAKNLKAIEDVLMNRHGFALSEMDRAVVRHAHHIFALYAHQTGYGSNLTTVDFTNGKGGNGNFESILTAVDDRGRNNNFLALEESFRFIKEMEAKNLIVPVVGDFGGNKALPAIARYLKDREATVTAFYVSNVEQYLFQKNPNAVNGGAQAFYENVAALPLDGSSTFIRSFSTRQIKQAYDGFISQLGSMTNAIQVFREKGFKTVRDVLDLR